MASQLTGKQTEISSTGRSQTPLLAKVSDQCVALGRDETTIFVDEEGAIMGRRTLEWTEQPLSMGESTSVWGSGLHDDCIGFNLAHFQQEFDIVLFEASVIFL